MSESYVPPEQFIFEICYVVPTTRNLREMGSEEVHTEFLPPGRRCRLARIKESDWDSVLVAQDNIRYDRPHAPQSLRKIVGKTVEAMRAFSIEDERTPEHIDATKVTAGTFVEYQRDGTWSEVCANRMYSGFRLCLPEIPPAERPNPELHRVLDADIDFDLRLVENEELPSSDYD